MSEKGIDWLLEEMDKATLDHCGMLGKLNADRALFHLLTEYKDRLPVLDHYFHKAFRQVDVTDSGDMDMVFWCLLHHSKLFWGLFEQVRIDKPEERP